MNLMRDLFQLVGGLLKMVTDNRTLQQLQFGTRIDQMLGDTEYAPTFDNKDLRFYVRALDWGGGSYSVEQWMAGDIGIYDVNNPHKCRMRAYFLQSWRGSGDTPSGSNESYNLGVFGDTKGGAYLEFWHWDDAVNDPCVGSTYFVAYPNYGSNDAYVWIKDANFIVGSKLSVTPNSGDAIISWEDTLKTIKTKDSSDITYTLGYTDRGDPSSVDYDQTDLTADGTWNDLDLSSIVPAGVKLVDILLSIEGTTKGSEILLRKNGNTNAINTTGVTLTIANSELHADCQVSCDSSRVIEYNASSSGINVIEITVKGWWI